MEKKKTISQYRERLDNTLSSAELTDPETLKTLVENQILRYAQDEKEEFSEHVLDKRANEVSNFLDMLRSTSIDDHQVSKSSVTGHGEWNVKHDNDEFRVMYREGPHGTPFHTLLVEGFVEGPLDVCLSVSWESALYKKWWPQSSFPPFKVTNSTCLQKIRINEQIALVRVKVTWPLSAREALVHFFSFEYFKDDLMVTLFNSISDVGNIDKATHGYTNNGIPEAKDVVRIDVVGGFALQKVNNKRSYFRTIANLDMKLDFVPPSLINFIARQLIGNGFRLFQKTVASVTDSDEDYNKALEEPLCCLIRDALYSGNKSNEVLEGQELKSEPNILPNEHVMEGLQDNTRDVEPTVHAKDPAGESPLKKAQDVELMVHANDPAGESPLKKPQDVEPMVHANDPAGESPLKKAQDRKRKTFGEIEEEESEENTCLEEGIKAANQPSTKRNMDSNSVNAIPRSPIRPEVEEALGTLEKVISIVRKYGFNAPSRSSRFCDEETPNFDVKDSTRAVEDNVSLKIEVGHEAGSKNFPETLEMTSDESKNSNDINDTRSAGSISLSREVNHNKIVPASPQQNVKPVDPYENGTIKTNGFREKDAAKLSKNHRFCCFGVY